MLKQNLAGQLRCFSNRQTHTHLPPTPCDCSKVQMKSTCFAVEGAAEGSIFKRMCVCVTHTHVVQTLLIANFQEWCFEKCTATDFRSCLGMRRVFSSYLKGLTQGLGLSTAATPNLMASNFNHLKQTLSREILTS